MTDRDWGTVAYERPATAADLDGIEPRHPVDVWRDEVERDRAYQAEYERTHSLRYRIGQFLRVF